MALSIKNPEADQLARELAALTGESMTDAVIIALRERIEVERSRRGPGIAESVRRLAAEYQSYPVTDPRTPDEIIGYDEDGVPT